MLKELKGRVVLQAAPDKAAAKKILALMSKLHQDASAEELAIGIMNPPFVLVKKTKISSAQHIVDYFEGMGAKVEFVPFTMDETRPFEDSFELEFSDDDDLEKSPRKQSLIKKALEKVVRSVQDKRSGVF